MSKLCAPKSSYVGQFPAKRSAAEELATFQAVVTALKSHPKELRAVVNKAGITTSKGNLKSFYKD